MLVLEKRGLLRGSQCTASGRPHQLRAGCKGGFPVVDGPQLEGSRGTLARTCDGRARTAATLFHQMSQAGDLLIRTLAVYFYVTSEYLLSQKN